MKCITVKEHRIAGVHFDIDQLKSLKCYVDSFHVRPGLITGKNMVDSA